MALGPIEQIAKNARDIRKLRGIITDDVLEFVNSAALPVEGKTSKIYITLDENKIYRWTGTEYQSVGGGGDIIGKTANTGLRLFAVINSLGIPSLQVFDTGDVNNYGPGGILSNTVYGTEAFRSNISGAGNTIIGYQAGNLLTTGTDNVAVGRKSLMTATTGARNVAIGPDAMRYGIVTGNENVAIGYNSMRVAASARWNVAIGLSSLNNVVDSAEYNTAVGVRAMSSYTGGSTRNTGIGYQALPNLTTGGNNTGIGTNAGGGITTGSGNTIIGSVGGLSATLTNTVAIGDGSGNVRLYIPDTGNLLVGTTTDAGYKLDVNGSARFGDLGNAYYATLTNGGADGGIFRVGGASYGYAQLVSYALTLNGGHGISGTGGTAQFSITSNVAPTAAQSNAAIRFVADNPGSAGGEWGAYSNALAFNFLKKETSGSYTSILALNGSTNNVGIGTITPTERLDVVGNISLGSTTTVGLDNVTGKITFKNGTHNARIQVVQTYASFPENQRFDFYAHTITPTPAFQIGFDNIISNVLHTFNGNTLTPSNKYQAFEGSTGTNEGIYLASNGSKKIRLSSYYISLEGNSNEIFQATDGTNIRMRMPGNGNLLIGTTTDAGYKLDVNGTVRTQGTLTVGVTGQGQITAGTLFLQYPATISYTTTYGLAITPTTAGSGYINIDGSSMRFLAANNGISFTQPTGKRFLIKKEQGGSDQVSFLDISGADMVVSGYATNGGSVRIYGGTTAGVASHGNVILAHDGTATRGYVGIGTSTPTTLLEVNGTSTFNGDIIKTDGTTTTKILANATSGAILSALIPSVFGVGMYMNRSTVYGYGVVFGSIGSTSGNISGANLTFQDLFNRSVSTTNVKIGSTGMTSTNDKILDMYTDGAVANQAYMRFWDTAGWGYIYSMGISSKAGHSIHDYDFRYGASDLDNGTLVYRVFGLTKNFVIGTTTDAGEKLQVNGTARVSSTLQLDNGAITWGNFSGAPDSRLRITRRTGWGTGTGIEIGALNTNTSAFASTPLVIGDLNTLADVGTIILGTSNNIQKDQTIVIGYNNSIPLVAGVSTQGQIILGASNTANAYTNGQVPGIIVGNGNTQNSFAFSQMYGTLLKPYADNQLLFGANAGPVNPSIKEVYIGYGYRNEIDSVNQDNGNGNNLLISPSHASNATDKNGGNLTLAASRGTGAGTPGNLILATATTTTTGTTLQTLFERMRINGSGNVLIGTTTDAGYRLDVNGTARVTALRAGDFYALGAFSAGISGGGVIGTFQHGTAGYGHLQFIRAGFAAGGIYLSRYEDYDVVIGAGNYGSTLGIAIRPAQIGGVKIGGDNATVVHVDSAILNIESTTKGVLFPRMTTAERVAIVAPVNGLVVFDTTIQNLCYRRDNVWVQVAFGAI